MTDREQEEFEKTWEEVRAKTAETAAEMRRAGLEGISLAVKMRVSIAEYYARFGR